MSSEMSERVAFVAGGSKDTGTAAVHELVRRGARVVVADIDAQAAQAVVESTDDSGKSVIAVRCDVADEAQVKMAFAETIRRFGQLDYLINLAGPYRPRDPLEQWEFMVKSNLLGTLYTCRHAIELMKSRGGSIVNIASDSGLGFGPEQQPAYGAAKAGVMRFTAALQYLAASHGIRVNCVVPDWIGTHAVMSWINSLSHEERVANHVPARMITTEEFAAVILDVATRQDLAGRIVLCWSGKPLEVIDYGDRGYSSALPF